jgi:hypothetical protein
MRSATVKFLALLSATAVVLVVWATAGAARTAAGAEPHLNSGLVGMTSGQMVRFNVTNSGNTRAMIIDGCRFVDAEGRVLKQFGRGVLAMGQSVSFDLDRRELGGDFAGRAEVNAIVSFVGKAEDITVTTQVIDVASGESRVGYTGNHNETLVRDEGRR